MGVCEAHGIPLVARGDVDLCPACGLVAPPRSVAPPETYSSGTPAFAGGDCGGELQRYTKHREELLRLSALSSLAVPASLLEAVAAELAKDEALRRCKRNHLHRAMARCAVKHGCERGTAKKFFSVCSLAEPTMAAVVASQSSVRMLISGCLLALARNPVRPPDEDPRTAVALEAVAADYDGPARFPEFVYALVRGGGEFGIGARVQYSTQVPACIAVLLLALGCPDLRAAATALDRRGSNLAAHVDEYLRQWSRFQADYDRAGLAYPGQLENTRQLRRILNERICANSRLKLN